MRIRAWVIGCLCVCLAMGVAMAQEASPGAKPPEERKGDSAMSVSSGESGGASGGSEGREAHTPPPPRKLGKPTEGEDKKKEGEGEKEASPAKEGLPVKLEGDIITLQSGTILSSVQVVRETPLSVVVQIRDGVPPLELPRRQVVSIKYDDIDPNRQPQASSAAPQTSAPDLFKAEELSPAFHRKITAPLSEQPLSFQNVDCVQMLQDLSKQAGIDLEISDAATPLFPKEPACSFEIKPGTSLLSFLQDMFVKSCPDLKALYPFDKVVITSKAAAEAQASSLPASTPAESPAPPQEASFPPAGEGAGEPPSNPGEAPPVPDTPK